jgi:hypothetical protein
VSETKTLGQGNDVQSIITPDPPKILHRSAAIATTGNGGTRAEKLTAARAAKGGTSNGHGQDHHAEPRP